VDISGLSLVGTDITYRLDADRDGVAETYLGTDAGGDGVMTAPGDVLSPQGDTNGHSESFS